MEFFNLLVSFIVIILVIYFLIKQYDTKLVLFTAGLFMSIVALSPMTALDAFAQRMSTDGIVQVVCSVLGFAAVMKITECDKHLVHLLAGMHKKVGIFLVPVVTLTTFLINIALPSATGCAAAVGSILIPLLIHSGVRPVMAAAAVFSGTFGSVLSPGLAINTYIANLAEVSVLDVIDNHKIAAIVSIIIVASTLGILAIYLNEHKGYETEDEDFNIDIKTKVKPIFALMNFIPLTILILGTSGLLPFLKMGIAQAMLIGVILAVIVTRTSPSLICDKFFSGMGGAYANILGIIISATVFVSGLQSLGLVDIFIDFLISNPNVSGIGATLGPFFLAIIVGSGDAASFTFNEIVTPHAYTFGMTKEDMGSLTVLSGAIGRTMSPLAGGAIICAGFAKVSTIDVVKRTFYGMILALISTYVIIGM